MKNVLTIGLCLMIFCLSKAQEKTKIPYGYNEQAGAYFEVEKETRLYYEVYGEGEPILMLHGGVYGYIDEFEFFIDALSKDHKVICLATRGHVKSDIGQEPFTYAQRARDAHVLLEHLDIAQATVIGFSDGGYSAYTMAADYPENVKKMVVIGAGDAPPGSGVNYGYSEEKLMKEAREYFKNRLAHMPEPDRWGESLDWLNALYEKEVVSQKILEKINCPVLIMAGDGDEYSSPDTLLKAHKWIKQSQLSLIPGCGHVVFYCNWNAVWASVAPFLKK
ncbi:MAG: alpha/beta hydrolase [Bacteroidota bacterium]